MNKETSGVEQQNYNLEELKKHFFALQQKMKEKEIESHVARDAGLIDEYASLSGEVENLKAEMKQVDIDGNLAKAAEELNKNLQNKNLIN